MATAISNPSIVINNIPVGVVPNSVTMNEGLGEYNYRAQSAGGSNRQGVFSINVEGSLPWVKFSLFPTPENIENAKNWKNNFNQNAITLTGTLPNGLNFSRSFNSAALVNNYEVALSFDGTFELNFVAESAI